MKTISEFFQPYLTWGGGLFKNLITAYLELKSVQLFFEQTTKCFLVIFLYLDDFGGTCNGDSGSPLVKFDVKTGTFTQRGLVSASRFGICGTRRYPNIYVRVGVPSILIWINQNKIGAHSKCYQTIVSNLCSPYYFR